MHEEAARRPPLRRLSVSTQTAGACKYYDASGNPLAPSGACQGVIRIDRNGDTFSAPDLVDVIGG